jgi:hypothetical protein
MHCKVDGSDLSSFLSRLAFLSIGEFSSLQLSQHVADSVHGQQYFVGISLIGRRKLYKAESVGGRRLEVRDA